MMILGLCGALGSMMLSVELGWLVVGWFWICWIYPGGNCDDSRPMGALSVAEIGWLCSINDFLFDYPVSRDRSCNDSGFVHCPWLDDDVAVIG